MLFGIFYFNNVALLKLNFFLNFQKKMKKKNRYKIDNSIDN